MMHLHICTPLVMTVAASRLRSWLGPESRVASFFIMARHSDDRSNIIRANAFWHGSWMRLSLAPGLAGSLMVYLARALELILLSHFFSLRRTMRLSQSSTLLQTTHAKSSIVAFDPSPTIRDIVSRRT